MYVCWVLLCWVLLPLFSHVVAHIVSVAEQVWLIVFVSLTGEVDPRR